MRPTLNSQLCVLFATLFVSLFCLDHGQAHGQTQSVGLGLITGSPRGVALQVPLTQRAALNSSLYYDLRDPTLTLHLDQIWLSPAGRLSALKASYYYGFGGLITFSSSGLKARQKNEGVLLLRAPLGGELGGEAVRVFAELTPAVEAAPRVRVLVQLAIGVRWHF